MIKSVLIDDEKNALEMLEWQLHSYCPLVEVVALCKNADDGIIAIQTHLPQLVFLDIEMPHKNGFEVLLQFPSPNFDVIFTTAYNQFAIKAFKFSALDYLVKPIDAEELINAVQRFQQKQPFTHLENQLEILLQQLNKPNAPPAKLAFSTQDGIVFVKAETILRCESSSNYTTLYFCDKSRLIISKTLKEVEELLQDSNFLRVHHSHLINLHQVSRYVKAEGGYIEMSDYTHVPISRQRKDYILGMLIKKQK